MGHPRTVRGPEPDRDAEPPPSSSAPASSGRTGRRSGRRVPAWAVLCTVVGALLMLGSGGALVVTQLALDRYSVDERDLFGELNPGADYGEDITGPLNVLLVGLDTRPSRPNEVPRADMVMIVHVNRELDAGYLISLPRDTLVDIPAEPETGFAGSHERLNAAMARGAEPVGGEESPNLERGFALLARTVSDLTGIDHFDAGAVINFVGFTDVVDALGGVTMELEEQVVSRHRQPNGKHRPLNPSGEGYSGPQMVYEPGVPPCSEAPQGEDGPFSCDLNGWQALDIARQRYGVDGGDYGRQDNQQLLLKAMMARAFSRDMITDPVAVDRVLRAAGDALTFDGRGRRVIDFAFALRDLRPSSMVTVGLPARGVGTGSAYQGEELQQEAHDLFAALRNGQIEEFMVANPDMRS